MAKVVKSPLLAYATLASVMLSTACGGNSSSTSPAAAPVAPTATSAVSQVGSGAVGIAQTQSQVQGSAPAVQALTTIIINKQAAVSQYSQQTLTLNFGVTGAGAANSGVQYQCKRETDKGFNACPNGASYTFTGLQNGAYSLAVQALVGANVAASDSVAFTVALPATSSASTSSSSTSSTTTTTTVVATAPATAAAPQVFQVGSFYSFTLPTSMHMTEYATNVDPQAAQEFFRVDSKTDPTYIGNYACSGTFDMTRLVPDFAGNAYKYCSSTPPADLNSWMSAHQLADNHLQVASNVAGPSQAYITINLFDAKYQYQKGRSVFESLCAGLPVTATPKIPFMTSFWGNQVNSVMLSCDTHLVSSIGINGTGISDWVVSTFFITTTGLDLPQAACYGTGTQPSSCATYVNPSFLEVTIVSRLQAQTDYEYAQDAQQLFESSLQQIVPLK